MSRELIILRHCKSDWDNNIRQDEQRPLSQRGIDNAEIMGQWMIKQSIVPDLVLCSTAIRARQTLALVNLSLNLPEDRIQFQKELYLASMSTLLQFLSKVDKSYRSVMMVGHNPGLDYLVDHVSSIRPELTSSGKLMTTGCLAYFQCPDDWHVLKQCGKLLSITRPADIIESNYT
ncbi:Phosphohistidine phosphatase SixA [hydrothermal vent metagenome]|uniref:Phosphohistidine phosphatase SixA n=1 Tax=hydrothermal vent metagenome TaxID=652676 RepID=A0A3B0ZZJ5_9ZZZZ